MVQKDQDLNLKEELTKYLQKRDEVNADEAAKSNVGKEIGGTKGNLILDYVSGSPNKPYKLERAPNVFDYDELTKYGFGYLTTPIMDAGGRSAVYELMEMVEPALPKRKPKQVQKLVIDREGADDQARYSGLKVTQILDDEEMGRKLQEVQQKVKEGKSLKKKLAEEEYVMPFADKRNTTPIYSPEWTPERLDEEGRKAGQAESWARRAKEEKFQGDPYESMNIVGGLQFYSVITSLFTAFAFGKSSPTVLSSLLNDDNNMDGLLSTFQAIALPIILASIGSSIVCAAILAPGKNRNVLVWLIKGYAGGPLAVLQLRDLDSLKTRGELGI